VRVWVPDNGYVDAALGVLSDYYDGAAVPASIAEVEFYVVPTTLLLPPWN
jgi:hypothetical protein